MLVFFVACCYTRLVKKFKKGNYIEYNFILCILMIRWQILFYDDHFTALDFLLRMGVFAIFTTKLVFALE